jgi:hypothetical protein
MSNWFNRNSAHLIIAGIFFALALIYFSPALQGKSLVQHDVVQAKAMAHEIMAFKAKDGKAPLWTNSAFGGMPSYQIWTQFPNNITTYVIDALNIIFPDPIDTVLLYLFGAYLLFCVLGISPWLAAAGAIAIAFSSYNFIIIAAGHGNKAMAIAFFAPILAGIVLAFRGKYLTGAILTSLFLAIEIRTNHIQMTYYLFIALLIFVGIELYHAIKKKETESFFKSFGYLAVAALIAVGINAGMLWTTYEYSQESTRGKSNLTTDKSEPNTGLAKDYAYQYSQGVAECITFLIPNAYGGSSSTTPDEDSDVAKALVQMGVPANQLVQTMQQAGLVTYWGERPFTAGPYYLGSVVFLLFILGLFIVRGRFKWWIVSSILLSLFLSFGNNLPFVSDLFFNYFPLYNKFRAVESVLVIVNLLFPVLAILALNEVVSGKIESRTLLNKFMYSLYITVGVLIVIIVLPTLFFSFKNSTHLQYLEQLTQMTGQKSIADSLVNGLINARISLARTDAIRSLLFVLAGAALVWALIKQKLSTQIAFSLLAILVLVDMWNVNRRYLNNENFVEKNIMAQQMRPRQVDELIIRDQSPNYRVFDLTVSTFSNSSNFFNSIGGYHAAKLKRYQEVIDKQFSQSINEDVLDMLNTKYAITDDESGQSQRIQNRSTAIGNAWFVPDVVYVKGPDQEMTAINSFDPRKVAYIDESFAPMIDTLKAGYDPNAFIRLTDYRPDHLVYEYSAARDVVAIFAEIWYSKGWNAYVDGEKIDHFRANYILRGAQLPGGNHKLEFKFEPTSYYTGETISLISSLVLIVALGFLIFKFFKKEKSLAS